MKPRTDPSILLRRYWENPDTPVVRVLWRSASATGGVTLRETRIASAAGTGRLAAR